MNEKSKNLLEYIAQHASIKNIVQEDLRMIKNLEVVDKAYPVGMDDDEDDFYKNNKTWSASFDFNGWVLAYCVQKFFDEFADDSIIIDQRNFREVKKNYTDSETILLEGTMVYAVNGQLIKYNALYRSHQISSNRSIEWIVDAINIYIKEKNPLKGKNLQIEQTYDGWVFTLKEIDGVNFTKIIIDNVIKEDIMDNTIFHIQNLTENNGIILYGPPGTGKSLICSAIAKEANQKDVTTIIVTNRPPFPMIDEVIKLFSEKSIIFFEDIDSFGESRQNSNNEGLSEFLQFVNGISTREESTIYIATTNYLDHLDDAIKKRPARFNRSYKIDYPKPLEIIELFKLYFSDTSVDSNEFDKYAEVKKITGAYIAEIKRTCKVLSKKRNISINNELFHEGAQKVFDSFQVTLADQKIGFSGK